MYYIERNIINKEKGIKKYRVTMLTNIHVQEKVRYTMSQHVIKFNAICAKIKRKLNNVNGNH